MVFNLLNCVSKPTRSVESIGYLDSQLVHLRSGSVSMNHLYLGLLNKTLTWEGHHLSEGGRGMYHLFIRQKTTIGSCGTL